MGKYAFKPRLHFLSIYIWAFSRCMDPITQNSQPAQSESNRNISKNGFLFQVSCTWNRASKTDPQKYSMWYSLQNKMDYAHLNPNLNLNSNLQVNNFCSAPYFSIPFVIPAPLFVFIYESQLKARITLQYRATIQCLWNGVVCSFHVFPSFIIIEMCVLNLIHSLHPMA